MKYYCTFGTLRTHLSIFVNLYKSMKDYKGDISRFTK